MPSSNTAMIKKLQTAINMRFGAQLLVNKTQFFSKEQNRPITIYTVRKAVWDDEKNRYSNIELFKSVSEIQIVLFLRDMWYELNHWEVPTDNEIWNNIKNGE